MTRLGEMRKTAIIAGSGVLPRALVRRFDEIGHDHLIVVFQQPAPDWVADHDCYVAQFEKLGALFETLKTAGCDSVVCGGALGRPRLDQSSFDAKTRQLAPRLWPPVGKGDDATLRIVAAIFESEGYHVLAVQDVLPEILADAGPMGAHEPEPLDLRDIERAGMIVRAMGVADTGQGTVVAQGLCLGLESLQGTDVMLDFVARTAASLRPDPDGARGVLLKAPKPGQDRRLDLPAIGPVTMQKAAAAGLAGVAVEPGGVLILAREETIAQADRLGIFLYGWTGPE
ncbi:MAG: LpxI family protein [Paracoccaceae bacterium]